MNKQYTINYDSLNKLYFSKINSDTISSKNLGDVLLYIGRLHDYTPQTVLPNLEFLILLETLLDIEIDLKVNW